jgi:REP element-mobilizing transposase RayT
MPRRKDAITTGKYYHVYNRGINHTRIFQSSRNYFFFINQLKNILIPTYANMIAYVLMPTHFHFLVEVTSEDFPKGFGRFSNSYTKAFNIEQDRSGPLFESRFKAKSIEKDDYILALSRYIHLNPVKANLVKKPEDWPWSSYPEILGQRAGNLPKTDFLLNYFSGGQPERKYQDFVDSELPQVDQKIQFLNFE